MILVNGSEVPEISRGAKSLQQTQTVQTDTYSTKFKRNSLNTTENIYIYALSRRFAIEEQKQTVTFIIHNGMFVRKPDQETEECRSHQASDCSGRKASRSPSLDDMAVQTGPLSVSVQLQSQMNLTLNLLVWIHTAQIQPVIQACRKNSFHSEMISTGLNHIGFVQIQNSMRSRFFSPVYSI